VANLVGLSVIAVRYVLRRCNRLGPDGLTDRRRGNGAAPRLTTDQRAALRSALRKRPPDGGLWSGPKVARYVRGRWGVRVTPQAGWLWLRELGFTLQVPRPSHPSRRRRGRPAALEKNLRARLRRLRQGHPEKAVEVWAEDECRLGLKPIARRVWSPKGQRPRSGGRTRYDWLYVYGFTRPRTGETFAALLPRVNADRMGDALAALATHADPGGRKVLVVLLDNAGWPGSGPEKVSAEMEQG
jgi:transposase